MKLSEIEKQEFERYIEKYDFSESFKGKTLLVTGCKGIVGSGVIKWLLNLNYCQDLGAHIIASTRKPLDNAVYNAVVIEKVAGMDIKTLLLNPQAEMFIRDRFMLDLLTN